MSQERLTRRDLAERLAGSADPDAVRLASGRIQHWTESGLLLVIGETKHVGRGQTRTYRYETLWACAILAAMADRGAGILDMSTAVMIAIRPLLLKLPTTTTTSARRELVRQRKLIAAAIAGEKTVILMIRTPAVSVDNDPDRLGNVRFDEVTKIEIPTGWPGGYWIDVTEAFAKVR